MHAHVQAPQGLAQACTRRLLDLISTNSPECSLLTRAQRKAWDALPSVVTWVHVLKTSRLNTHVPNVHVRSEALMALQTLATMQSCCNVVSDVLLEAFNKVPDIIKDTLGGLYTCSYQDLQTRQEEGRDKAGNQHTSSTNEFKKE
jgi:hypothetical protein